MDKIEKERIFRRVKDYIKEQKQGGSRNRGTASVLKLYDQRLSRTQFPVTRKVYRCACHYVACRFRVADNLGIAGYIQLSFGIPAVQYRERSFATILPRHYINALVGNKLHLLPLGNEFVS